MRHRSAVLVTPPAAVLSVAEGKLCAGLDWLAGDVRDAQMARFIAAATAKVEQDTGLALLPQTYDVFYDSLPRYCAVPLPWRPATSAAFSAIDSTGTRVPLVGATYILDGSSASPLEARVQLVDAGASWPAALRSFQPWVIQTVVGFANVAAIPAPLLHAVGLLTAHYATVGRDLVIVGTIVASTPLGYEDLIAPYQLVTLA
jgi:uncharacterized phiE125 gp8 family phage protein